MFSEPWLKLLAKVGTWAALAMFLVYRIDQKYSGDLEATRKAATASQATLEQHSAQMIPLVTSMQQLVNIQLQQCVNAADDFVKRDRCFQAMYTAPTR